MADYDLKYTGAQIDALLDAANELKTNGFIYKGVATPSTNPGTPTERVAYLASEPGTYTNFGGIVIASGLYSLTYASGTWTGT
jgi:adenosylcobinamide amidohydrolase